MLNRMLVDFGPNNWTSELRHCVPGFAPFRGSAYADFTYEDTRGQLTREWFGPEKATMWHGRWPRYHIEVKSTRGEENETFHMSRVQMITVRVPTNDGGVCIDSVHHVRRLGSRNVRMSARTYTSSCAYRVLACLSRRIWSTLTHIEHCSLATCSMRMTFICSVTLSSRLEFEFWFFFFTLVV